MSILPISKVSRCWHETWRWVFFFPFFKFENSNTYFIWHLTKLSEIESYWLVVGMGIGMGIGANLAANIIRTKYKFPIESLKIDMKTIRKRFNFIKWFFFITKTISNLRKIKSFARSIQLISAMNCADWKFTNDIEWIRGLRNETNTNYMMTGFNWWRSHTVNLAMSLAVISHWLSKSRTLNLCKIARSWVQHWNDRSLLSLCTYLGEFLNFDSLNGNTKFEIIESIWP